MTSIFGKALIFGRTFAHCSFKPSTCLQLMATRNFVIRPKTGSIGYFGQPFLRFSSDLSSDAKVTKEFETEPKDATKEKTAKKHKRKQRRIKASTYKNETVTKPLAKSFNLKALVRASEDEYTFWHRYKMEFVDREFDHVLHVCLKPQYHQEKTWLREFYVFEEGVVTFWGMDSHEIGDVTENILKKSFASNIIPERYMNEETEKMPFVENEYGHDCIRQDGINLTNMDNHQDGVLKRIAFSQGLAVNVILGIWEQEMDDIKKPFESLSKDLVDSKKLWNIKKCKKHLGLLSMFRYRSNLESDLFDTDDFWEYPNLEAIYNSTTRHFEIESRRRILNKNIDDCENLLKNVENIVFHEKSWKLEWYIIILITIEIIINIDKLISIFWMVLENGLKFTGLKRNEIGTEKEISRR